MPELPDVEAYLLALRAHTQGEPLEQIRLKSPFLLRSVEPPLSDFVGERIEGFERIGKRIVFVFPRSRFLVLHLMIAGRLRWRKRGAGLPGKMGLAAFDFPAGSLVLTEASTRKRAWLRAASDRKGLAELDPGGVEPLDVTAAEFLAALKRENRTLKRGLTDPRILSGIGNAYSDEILHRARLSPLKRTRDLDAEQGARLFDATVQTLSAWRDRLCREAKEAFPDKVTAFREGMAVHGRYAQPCPDCGAPVQRILYAASEANYCARCQTGGRVLADRVLSKLLKDDWPRRIEELEGG